MATVIAVVDDDIAVRESLQSLIRSVGLSVRVFASAEEFLNSGLSVKADCLVLDVRLPGMSGIELHQHLVARKYRVPVIFITGHGSDEHARAEAVSDWTVAYLIKPFDEEALLEAINKALKWQPVS
ncbi:MAG: response regulator [Acidobacteriia bacterium]|nr:response regulator [Terriglobia bacterium]